MCAIELLLVSLIKGRGRFDCYLIREDTCLDGVDVDEEHHC